MIHKAIGFFASLLGSGGSGDNLETHDKAARSIIEPLVVEFNSPLAGAGGVTVLSLGIETLGGVFTPILPVGTAFPCSITETFSTAADRQTVVTIKLYRGDRILAQDNAPLGDFQIVGIPPAPRGTPQINVAFQVTAAREIRLFATEKRTGQPLGIVRG